MAFKGADENFHGTTLVESAHGGSTLTLKIVYLEDTPEEEEAYVHAVICGLEKLFRSDVLIPHFEMEDDTASILQFMYQGNDLELALEWENNETRATKFCVYRMSGSALHFTIREVCGNG